MKLIKHYLIGMIIFISLVFFVSSHSSSSHHLCQDDQKSILLQFINEFFPYSNPNKLVSWKPNSRDCCSWEGITCDNATGYVTGLDLSNGDLEGTIHSHSNLFKLHTLLRLDLSSNFFLTSNFSSENYEDGFALLSSLTHLNLSNTQFSGQVPLQMSRLTKLVSLDLSSNGWLKLESPNLERLIQNMSSLRVLHLDRVNMTTQNTNWCDALSSAVPELIVLSLSYCSISGPLGSTLSNLHFLSEIDLSGNPLSSKFPEFLVNMSPLMSIRLGDCGLHGELPADILRLPGLNEIDVSLNHDLQGPLPEFPYHNSLRILRIRNTGFQGKIPESIGNLEFLAELDLYGLDLSGPIPYSIGNLRKLQNLDLSSNHFNDSIPDSIGKLVELKSLLLSSNHFEGSIPSSIGNLRQLKILDLSFNHLDGSLPSSIGNLKQLQALDLSSNHLHGSLPSSIGRLGRLRSLDLSSNHLDGSIPSSIGNLKQLQSLDLSFNRLHGLLPSSIGDLRNLQNLDLSSNNFSGKIPDSIVNLVSLEELDLSSNSFRGSVPYRTHPNNITDKFHELPNLLPDSGLLRLTSLDFSENSLEGIINYSLFTLPSLEYLDLQMNAFQALPLQVPYQPSPVLSYIHLSDNVLQGPIPGWIAQLTSLSMLDLSSNEFNGSMDMDVLSNLINLQELHISDNHYCSITASPNSTFPLLSKFESHSCNLVEFPTFLRNAPLLNDLDMSNNRIKGQIPSWIWNEHLLTLNLSMNLLTGLEEPFPNASASTLMVLDLHSNQLQGSLPVLMPHLAVFFSVSGNTLVGKIPTSICNTLDLSNNNLIGPIPNCVGNISNSLFVINLGGNSLKGSMPQIYAASLTTLVLNGNQLQGRVPKSLYGCQKLEVLDLGNNQIHDTFPFRLENLLQLRVLVLKPNRFYGQIEGPRTKNAFPLLHYIDLSFNAFTGELPFKYFQAWKAMMKEEEGDKSGPHYLGVKLGGYYEFRSSMDVKMKGGNFQLGKILDVFTSIDLSHNHFEGKIIPESIGELKSLHVLDLSGNNLDGPIPSSMENLHQLESSTLSKNKLSGEIPVGLVTLTFLSFLDLAGNNLEGPIPTGGQFNTFPPKSYEGNPQLCGFPLSKKCRAGEEAKPWEEVVLDYSDLGTVEFEWRAAWMGYGCGVLAGLSIGYIFFWGNSFCPNHSNKKIS